MNAADLPIAETWWVSEDFGRGFALLREPNVVDFLRCNVWHVKGRGQDLVIDTGLGLAPLLPHIDATPGSAVTVVLTHTHADHAGGWHEFKDRCVHHCEAGFVDPQTAEPDLLSLWAKDLDAAELAHMRKAGYDMPECFVTALPFVGASLDALPFNPAAATRLLSEGDVIDLGDRAFEVLHLPGHSPGSIGLLDRRSGVLLSGDTIYDGPLLDELAGSDIDAYKSTMQRLLDIHIDLVLPGHGAPFGESRLREIATGYLGRRTQRPKGHSI
ncbi:MAG: MBL fold metallo-hydrolase [Gemmatimonadales bacterium]|nr:MBL fold metallo-hydrolase [Gemmatimonadales bacterium]MBT7430970.1 MBL fold metallo-hydrolase [Ilumatobacter sp.]